MLVACGDDDSDIATCPSGDSSSSVTPKSSDSETSVSSSSTSSSSNSEYTRVPCDVETDENCFEDARDGQTYKTVTIGSQVWMAENLNYKTAASYCYNDNVSNCTKYGRLYTWAAAVGKSESECGYGYTCSLPSGNIQGVCPNGWHLPSKSEWETLISAVGGSSVAGTKLKSTLGWYNSGNGTDAFSFSVLPAGWDGNGYYNYKGYSAYFWSSMEDDSGLAYGLCLYYGNDSAYLNYYDKDDGFSVRCLKDNP